MASRVAALVLTVLASSCTGDRPAALPRPAAAAPAVVAVEPARTGLESARTATGRRVPPAAPETLAVLASGLASPDYAVRLLATEALGCVPTAGAVRQLEAQLGDAEADVVAAAIGSLHRQPGARARALLASVRDDNKEDLALRVLAAAALVTPAPSCQRISR